MEHPETYWKGILEITGVIHNLALESNKNQEQNEFRDWLNEIQSIAEFRSGKYRDLTDEIGLSSEFRKSTKPPEYWGGVADVVELVKDFLSEKEQDLRNLGNFLVKIKSKAKSKLRSDESILKKEMEEKPVSEPDFDVGSLIDDLLGGGEPDDDELEEDDLSASLKDVLRALKEK